MPIQVHIPIRLRVDAEAITTHPGSMDAALARGLGRALARSRKDVLRRTGAYLGLHIAPPQIRWSGEALAQIPIPTRTAIESRVAALIAGAIEAAELHQRADAHAPLAAAPVERSDPRRRRMFGRYVVDSYEGDTTTITFEEEEEQRGVPWVKQWALGAIVEIGNLNELRRRVQFERAGSDAAPTADVQGLVVRRANGWDVLVTTDGFATRERAAAFNFPVQMWRAPVRRGHDIVFEERPNIPRPTSCSLIEIPLPESLEERIELLRTWWGPKLRADILDIFDPGEAEDELLMTEAEFQPLVEDAVARELENRAKAIPDGWRALMRLDWGDTAFLVALPTGISESIQWASPATNVAQLLPVTFDEQRVVSVVGTGSEIGSPDPSERARGTGRGTRGDGARGRGGARGDDGRGSRYGIGGEGGEGEQVLPAYGIGETLVCEPFLDTEPEPEALGAAGERMAALVAEIAERLGIPPCRYAATFCVHAATTLEGRAYAVGHMADLDTTGTATKPANGTRGTLGHISFSPVASPAIQLLRRLAQAAMRVEELWQMINDFYMDPAGGQLLGGRYQGQGRVSWVLRFDQAVVPLMKAGVAAIFTQMCQVIMLQLLVTSAGQIAARQRNLRAYAPIFQDVMVRRLSNIGKLTTLRDRLKDVEDAQRVQQLLPSGVSAVPGLEWTAAARALADACVATEGFAHMPGAGVPDIVWQDGVARIRDDHGFLWTRQALEEAMVRSRGEAESLDPLIQQIADIPETVERFRQNPGAAEALLSDLLDEMARLNDEKQREARSDPLFGLQAGRIVEDSSSDQVPGAPYRLAGIHLLAHQEIGEFFRGEWIYGAGIDYAFSVELGKQGIAEFFVFTGLALLAVVCPPAAFAAGVSVAAVEVARAESRADLYRSLINPELVLSRAEIELDRYIAYAGLVLSLLPEATTVIRAASVGIRGAARSGLGAGLRIAGRSVVRSASRQVTEALAREAMPALLREVATNLVMDRVVQAVAGPVIENVLRELQLRTAVGGRQGALQLIDAIERSAARRAASPLPGEVPGTAASREVH